MKKVVLMVAVLAVVGLSTNAFAWSVPSSGSFGYDIYDLVVNDFLKGPIGFVVALGFVVAAVFTLVRMMIPAAVVCIIAACVLFAAPSMVESFGFLIG